MSRRKLPTQAAPVVSAERAAQSLRSRFTPIRGITPELLATYLDSFRAGYIARAAMVWDEIELRDDTLSSVVPKRKSAAAKNGWEIVRVETDDEAAAKAHEHTLRAFWDNVTVTSVMDRNEEGEVSLLCRQMMDARGKRYALHEILWDPAPGGLTARFQFAPLWFFENITGSLRYLPSEGAVNGQPLDRNNWLISVGEGLMYASSVAWMYKNLPLRDWLIYSERHGMPGIHGKTSATKGSTEWNALVDAVENFATDWSLVTSVGAEITKVDMSASGELPYPPLVDRMSRALAAIWRGADLSTMSAGNAAAPGTGASLQGDEMSLLESGDAAWLSETLSRQVDRRVIEYTYGPGVKPLAYIRIKTAARHDIAGDMQVDRFLYELGAPIGINTLLERYNRSLPDPTAQLLPPRAVPPQFPLPFANTAHNQRSATVDPLQSSTAPLLAAALAADLAPVRDRLETILDIEDPAFRDAALRNLQRDLPALLKAIAASPASARVLEDALAAAVLNGMTDAAAHQSPPVTAAGILARLPSTP